MRNTSKKRLIAAVSAVLMLGMIGTMLFTANAAADGASVPVAVNDNYGPDGFDGARLHGNVMDNDTLSEFWISSDVQNIVWMVRTEDGDTELTVPSTAYDPDGNPTVRTREGGKVWIDQDGSFEYQPATGFKGEDSFQYILRDGYDDGPPGSSQTSMWATVTFSVPLAVTWSLTANGTDGSVTTTHLFLQFDIGPDTLTSENITVTGAAKGVLSEDVGVYLFTLAIADITVGNGGTVTVSIASSVDLIVTPASLTVTVWMAPTAPVIFVQPSNSTITAGGNTSFTVAASASPAPAYQWQVSANGTTWNNISDGGVYSGAATATLVLTGAPISYNNNQYRCIVSNGISPDTVSNTAYLDVSPVLYAVVYDPNGGSGTAPTGSNRAAGATFPAANPSGLTAPEGKQFKEWNTLADGSGVSYASGATVTMPASNLTLYAIWEDIPAGGGGDDDGSPIMIVVAAIAVIAIAGFAAYWFLLRKP